MIEIECRVCDESIKTADVQKVIAFDREHTQTCPTPDETTGGAR